MRLTAVEWSVGEWVQLLGGIAIVGAFILQLICFVAIRRLRHHAKEIVETSAKIAAETVSKEVSVVAATAAVIAADELLKRSQH